MAALTSGPSQQSPSKGGRHVSSRNCRPVFQTLLHATGLSLILAAGPVAAQEATGGLSTASMLGWGWNSQTDAIIRSYQLVSWGSNVGRMTLGGQWWRLFTSMFLHGSLLHILFNMVTLWQAGQLVERLFGSLRFLVLYLFAGLCGSLASVLWNPHVNSVGASGAIFGIIGGLFAFMRRPDSGVPPTIVREVRGSLSGFLLFNIAAGLIYPHTDNAAHIGGLVGGYLAGFLLARSLHVPEPAARQ